MPANADANSRLEKILTLLEEIRARLADRLKPYYTVEEIAEMTGRSAYTVRRWIAEERVHATRIEGCGPRGRLLIAHDELAKLVGSGLGAKVPGLLQFSDKK